MNAWKVTLPLAIATLLAGLIIGFTSVSIVPSGTSTCGSAFNDKQGWNSENEQAACTPILSERDAWGTTLVFIGFGLFGATYLLNGPEVDLSASSGVQETGEPERLASPRSARRLQARTRWRLGLGAAGPTL